MIWFASDHHLFHKGILNFANDDGTLIRGARFKTIEEHNGCILENHNSRVQDGDHVYFMGDLTFNYGEEFLSLFAKFKGKKRLIPGNHDDIKKLAPLFKKVQIWRVFRELGDVPFTVSHVPIEPLSIKGKFNVHGHIHQNAEATPWHINLSMEAIDYTPVSYDELQAKLEQRWKDIENDVNRIAGVVR